MGSKDLVIGTNENFFEHEIKGSVRSQHLHVLGATGSGKSRFLLSLILQDIRNRSGVCLIDPHGELVGHVTDWLAKNESIAKRRPVRILSLNDDEWSFGFNPLAVSDPDQLEAVVDNTVTALASVMGGEDLTQTPLIRMTLSLVCMALASSNLTLCEAQYLLSPEFHRERVAIISNIKNPTYQKEWEVLDAMARQNPKLYMEQFQPAGRRFVPFISNRYVRGILGQSEPTLNLLDAMDNGEILLLDLSREGGKIPSESGKIIGRLFVNNLVARAYERSPRKAKPFNLYIDEVQNYLSGDIPEILSQCRKFGLHLTIAHQFLQQLREAGDLVYHGVMGTARNKVVFALDNPEDAQIMQRRIFTGKYDFEMAKKSLVKPTVVGHEVVQLRSSSSGVSEARTIGASTGESASKFNSGGFSEGMASGTSSGEFAGAGEGIVMIDGQPTPVSRHSVTEGSSEGKSSVDSFASNTSWTDGVTKSREASRSTNHGTSSNDGFSEALRPIFEDLPTAVYSREEQEHIFTDSVISLPERHAFMVSPSEPVIRFETLDVPDILVSDSRKKRVTMQIKSETVFQRPLEKIEKIIDERWKFFILSRSDFSDDELGWSES